MNQNIKQNNNVIITDIWREWKDVAKLCSYTKTFIYYIKLINLDIHIANKKMVTTRKQDIMLENINITIIQAMHSVETTTLKVLTKSKAKKVLKKNS